VGLVKNSSGGLHRGLRLGKLGLSLTGSYLGYQAQNIFLGDEKRDQRRRKFQNQSSRRVREELGSLKGAAMKLGQLLSLQTHELSEEAITELANLQMHAPGMHPTLARAQFKSSLGKAPEEVFRSFEPEPFAAASLGQVHRAVTRDGKKVAVKIQYPAIRAAIENDLKLLRSATLPARLIGHAPADIIDEIQRGFLEETDYLQESRNMGFFRWELSDLNYLTIPRIYPDLTTERVLTMSFVEGENIGRFLERKPAQAVRDLIGTRLVELYYAQMHRLKQLHADHHPGNYLFQPDGRIGLIDFGCVKRINFDASDLIRSCVERTWREGDKEASHVLRLVFGPGVPYARARKMLPTLEVMAGILYPEGKNADPVVDFGKAQLLKMLTGALTQALRDKVTNSEFAFISRAELGLYSLLHRLNARVNVRETWQRCSSWGEQQSGRKLRH
jgi:predicted unusual protein kinase regulating ubiquinone biosynthesis (AarF/ABC1/UbiB family)